MFFQLAAVRSVSYQRQKLLGFWAGRYTAGTDGVNAAELS
jgi:hypothetical protein